MVLHDASDKRLSNKNKIGLSPIPDAGVELSYVVGRLLFAEGLMQGFNWSDLGPVGSHFVKPVAFLSDWNDFGLRSPQLLMASQRSYFRVELFSLKHNAGCSDHVLFLTRSRLPYLTLLLSLVNLSALITMPLYTIYSMKI